MYGNIKFFSSKCGDIGAIFFFWGAKLGNLVEENNNGKNKKKTPQKFM
jgi:hypothetical protein